MNEVTTEQVYTEENLNKRLIQIYTEIEILKSDAKQLREDFTYSEELNTKGLHKETVKLVDAAAKIYVANNYEEKRAKALEVFDKYTELNGYDQ